MEKQENKVIAASYKLYTLEEDGKKSLVEIAPAEKPFKFMTGFGVTLDRFEQELSGLNAGEEFDFTITKDEAYGDFHEENIVKLAKETFFVDGKFDDQHVKIDAMLPMQNEEGQQFMARVDEITDTEVTIDLNHPLAGKSLNFVGRVEESRLATIEEINHFIKMLSGGCGGCGGGGCDGGNCEGGCEGGCGGCH